MSKRKRTRRIAGRRRSIWPTLAGWACAVVGGLLTLSLFLEWLFPSTPPGKNPFTAFLAALSFTVVISQYFFAIARRLEAAPATLADQKDSVLYLRAFDAENEAFVTGDRAVLGKYTQQLKAHVPLARGKQNTTISLTLEDFLEEEITAKLGPFVGLGNPSDRLPPDGAIREYSPDAQWQERFLALARNAKCIVVALASSDNLRWELEQIRANGLASKLCLFTSPRLIDKELGALTKALEGEVKRESAQASQWMALQETMRRAGYDLAGFCPGPGAAITFDETGKSMLLTTEASLPPEYMTPVADWFNSKVRSGRCVAAACTSCSATIHRQQDAAGNDTALCFSCKGKAELAQMSGMDRVAERHPWLVSIWGLVSLAGGGTLAVLLSLQWVGWTVGLAAIVFFSPWLIAAGVRRLRQKLIKTVT